ncbi:class I glutamine amidotransferase-like protein [Lophiostoma macrostomum CBS 122681]|uniref:D-lactate dehydratase n=1 Tax=Lophiostoma macrostomum CBS 122681 TaxID=1314788 RepID=A0A6A6TI79_9PLEO|nr:class I glutamine amidotransferase-like protein [Lophiostoma macrostomum CBS 122681]
MSLPRRAIITITSAHASLMPGEDGKPAHTTGVFIGEALHPYNVFTAAGFEVDIVSEEGRWSEDWLSLQPGFLSEEERRQYDDKTSEFRKKLDLNLKPGDVDAEKYGIFFASAGHAALIDYPTASGLKKIASSIWERGGVVSAVCHGAAIFPGIIDSATGKSIIAGRTITGFTTEGEDVMKVTDVLRSWGKPLVDEWAEQLGAKYDRPDDVWGDFHVTDGRIVTGTNPQSATSTAKEVVKVFEAL